MALATPALVATLSGGGTPATTVHTVVTPAVSGGPTAHLGRAGTPEATDMIAAVQSGL